MRYFEEVIVEEPRSLLGENLFYFDIETTGLNAGASMLYLIGAAYFCAEKGRWVLCQWLNEDGDSEKELLVEFGGFAAGYQEVVHFNGNGFDIPYLKRKYAQHELASPFSHLTSIDLYQQLRPVALLLGLENKKLQTMEKAVGYQRTDPFSGQDLIKTYFLYRVLQDMPRLNSLLLHNREDILSLFAVSALLNLSDGFHSDFTSQWQDNKEDNTVILTLTFTQPFPAPTTMIRGPFTLLINETTAQLTITAYTGELKYYYPNYKDYYYLPLEDSAIHKTVAQYVDPAYKEKAKPATCYTRKTATFLPQPTPLITPAFQPTPKSPLTYWEYQHRPLHPPLQTEYIHTLLTHLLQ